MVQTINKQKVEIRGAFAVDEFRDILSSLIFEGLDVKVLFNGGEWIIEAEKDCPVKADLTFTAPFPSVYQGSINES